MESILGSGVTLAVRSGNLQGILHDYNIYTTRYCHPKETGVYYGAYEVVVASPV